MIIGRAKCKECNSTLEAEVEKDVKCPGCGRVFQIPNAPQYTRPVLLRSKSLSGLSGTLGIQHLFGDTSYDSQGTNYDSQGTNWEFSKTPEEKGSSRVAVLLFPKREDAEKMQEEWGLWVIAQYPSHSSLEQIRRVVTEKTLSIESTLPRCPYRDIIEVGIFTKIFWENLNNGILEVKLNK